MHARIMHPGNVIIAVSGDFDPTAMLATLERAFAGWPKGEPVPDPPAPTAEMAPGVRYVQKDIPQGRVSIGLRTLERDDPDYIAMIVMNDILGGGGFSSRIMQSVRSNEGLAYSAGSRLEPNPWYAGMFQASFQSKSPTVVRAIKLIDDEFRRIRSEPVGEAELATSKASFIETFPGNFASKDQMLQIFVGDEWTGRPDGYWETFREKVQAVTPADITRVANKYLDPSRMAVLVVGNWADIYGNAGENANELFPADRPATELPLKDPLTLKPMAGSGG
jgi:zinc protease